jgi:hypothetical protein
MTSVRQARLATLAAALATCLVPSACGKRDVPAVAVVGRTGGPRLAVSREPEPAAVQAREEVIRRDADAIRAQCLLAAGGDWDKWQRDTAPFRADLKAKLEALKAFDPPPAALPECKYEPLEGRDGFPLFEVAPRESLHHLHAPEFWDRFRMERPVVAAHRWLREQGIDLIFVPLPKMTEVYPEHFLDPCPADGVIAPHVRRALLEMLEDGVEVVDGFSLFRPVRGDGPEYLYNTADSHWSSRGMRVMAKELAARMARYRFGAEARAAAPMFRTSPGPYSIEGLGFATGVEAQNGWLALNRRQQERARAVQATTLPHVTLTDGRVPPDDPESPVLVIGHSYVPNFRERLILELNLLTLNHWSPGQTTQSFADFLREPELIEGCKVVIWISTEPHLPLFRPLPEPVTAALQSEH